MSLPKPTYGVKQGYLQLINQGSGQAGTFLGLVIKRGTYTISANMVPQADLLQSLCLYGDAQNQLGEGASFMSSAGAPKKVSLTG